MHETNDTHTRHAQPTDPFSCIAKGDRVLLLRERQVCLTRRPTTPPWVAATVCLKTPGFKRRAEATVSKCRQHSSGFIDLRLDMYTTRSMMLAQRCSMQHTVSYLSRLRQLYLDPTQVLTNDFGKCYPRPNGSDSQYCSVPNRLCCCSPVVGSRCNQSGHVRSLCEIATHV